MKSLKFLLFTLMFPILVNAQSTSVSIDSVAHALLYQIRSIHNEQILLQTNKKIYSAKENIWFKAFEVDSATGGLMNKSKILFVDLVNDKDKVIHSVTLNMQNAQQEGTFAADSSLNGFYWIRAYTKDILNQNPNNMGVTACYILNGSAGIKESHINNLVIKTGQQQPLTLYPEGGHIMSGAATTIAVKLVDDISNPLSDSIMIKDDRNKSVANFQTNKNGLAKFTFEPSVYHMYAAYVLKNGHYDSILSLPKINAFSAQVAVEEQSQDFIKARVLLEDSIYKKDYQTYLIGVHEDSLCIAAQGTGNYELNVSLGNFPAGVATLLLYNKTGALLSARDFYVNKNNLNVSITSDKNVYDARDNVNMSVVVKNAQGAPQLAALTVSVNDARVKDSVNDFRRDTLSELSAEDIELAMLTQPLFNLSYWKDLYNVSRRRFVNDSDNALYIKGKILDTKHEPAVNKSVLLISNTMGNIFSDTTDKAGRFSFQPGSFNTGTPFNMQINNDVQNNYQVILDSAENMNVRTPAYLKKLPSAEELLNLKKTASFYSNSILFGHDWLPDVTVKAKATSRATNIFPETVITKEELRSTQDAGDAVLKFSKLRVLGGYLLYGGPNGFTAGPTDEPEIVMDGARIARTGKDLDFLKTLSTSSIDHIRVLTGASASGYGLIAGTGVIEIYSANDSTNTIATGNGLVAVHPKGFDIPIDYKMPDYSDKHVKNSKIEDYRTSIYWNSDVITDTTGTAQVSFYTADLPATYIVTVSGITENGDTVFKTYTINRK